MSLVSVPTTGLGEAPLTRPVENAVSSKTSASSHRRSHPKRNVVSAWAAWEANESAASGTEFLQHVSSWTEGTAAQLLRQQWPASAARPSSIDVQERLHHYLEVAAHGRHVTYLEALELARCGVIEEFRSARRLAARPIEAGVPDDECGPPPLLPA